jgi:peroxiredoxin
MSKALVSLAACAVFASVASAQGGGASPPVSSSSGTVTNPPAVLGPDTGTVAPDFSAPGADKNGTLKSPIKLSDFKGKTVILAFFPAARTSGCTTQMTHYRDEYDKIFMGGKDVVLLGISTDADTTLANWAKEANFPFRFVSDVGREIGLKYGTLQEGRPSERRFVYVINPDGRISYVKKPFSPTSQPHYDELTEAIHHAMPHAHK